MLTTLELADRTRVVVGRLARRMRQQAVGGLTPSQASILSTLDLGGPMSMSALAEREGISRPSTTGIVNRLAQRGLVERTSDPDDGRSSIVGVTDAAHELMTARRAGRNAFLAGHIERLDAEERAVLARALELMAEMK